MRLLAQLLEAAGFAVLTYAAFVLAVWLGWALLGVLLVTVGTLLDAADRADGDA